MKIGRRHFNCGLVVSLGALPIRSLLAQSTLRVNGKRIMDHILALAEFGKNPQGGVSRVAYSDADKQGREYVLGLMRAAKLDVTIDAAGNLIGRRAGSASGLAPLLIGSHVDSVPEGGNYDGVVGSMGAIEVAHTLAENNVTTRHPLEVVIFQNEEGGLIGSRAMDGELTEKELDLVSRSGKTIREGIKFIGGDPSKLADVRRKKGDIAGYLELHIEQGGTLDTEKIKHRSRGRHCRDQLVGRDHRRFCQSRGYYRDEQPSGCAPGRSEVYRGCESNRDQCSRQTSRNSWQDQCTAGRAERHSRESSAESGTARSRCGEDQYAVREDSGASTKDRSRQQD